MPQIKYGGSDGKTYELDANSEFMAVRTRNRRSLVGGPVLDPEAQMLDEFDLVFQLPEAGVDVFKRKSGTKTKVESAKSALKIMPNVRFAGSVLMDSKSQTPVLYTENIFIKFEDDCPQDHCAEIIGEAGLTIKQKIDYCRNGFFVSCPEGSGQEVFDLAMSLLDREDVEYCHPELIRESKQKTVFGQQWHLRTTNINGTAINASANVEGALSTTEGEGIVIAVIDDGVDVDHDEFSRSGKIVHQRDVTRSINNARPKFGDDDHGTACAGVACGDGRFGASGVAPKSKLMPIRLRSGLGSQAEANAFKWATDNGADVISCSWGPQDGRWFDSNDPLHDLEVPLPDSTRLAIEFAINNGRNGKGCVICWAAGNGNESVENDGYASFDKVLAIAACNDRGKRSVYSDFGKSIFCAFPSNDFGFGNHPSPLTSGIWTVDRSGGAGYNAGDADNGDADGDYTNDFGGTSSACPGAAGVAALILSLNPNLRWDQVKDIMRRSCDKIDPQNGDYQNGHSELYGFGRINAETAVRLAKPQPVVDQVEVVGHFMTPIRDFSTSAVELKVADDRELKSVEVEVDIRHTFIGDLTVELIPPSGLGVRSILLHKRSGGGRNNIIQSFDSMLVSDFNRLVGKSAEGTWALQVTDSAFRDQGFIRKLVLHLNYASPTTRRSTKPEVATKKSNSRKRKRTVAN